MLRQRSMTSGTLKRMTPKRDRETGESSAPGSRMALRINRPAIVNVIPPNVGEEVPAEVRAEVTLDVSRLSDPVRPSSFSV